MGEGEVLEKGPFPTGIRIWVVTAILVSLLLRHPDQERSQKKSAFVPLNCFIYPGTSTLPGTQQACADC